MVEGENFQSALTNLRAQHAGLRVDLSFLKLCIAFKAGFNPDQPRVRPATRKVVNGRATIIGLSIASIAACVAPARVKCESMDAGEVRHRGRKRDLRSAKLKWKRRSVRFGNANPTGNLSSRRTKL